MTLNSPRSVVPALQRQAVSAQLYQSTRVYDDRHPDHDRCSCGPESLYPMRPVSDPVRPAPAAHRQHSVEIGGYDHSRDSGLGKVNRAAEPWASQWHTCRLPAEEDRLLMITLPSTLTTMDLQNGYRSNTPIQGHVPRPRWRCSNMSVQFHVGMVDTRTRDQPATNSDVEIRE